MKKLPPPAAGPLFPNTLEITGGGLNNDEATWPSGLWSCSDVPQAIPCGIRNVIDVEVCDCGSTGAPPRVTVTPCWNPAPVTVTTEFTGALIGLTCEIDSGVTYENAPEIVCEV